MVRGGPISGGLKRYPHVEEALESIQLVFTNIMKKNPIIFPYDCLLLSPTPRNLP